VTDSKLQNPFSFSNTIVPPEPKNISLVVPKIPCGGHLLNTTNDIVSKDTARSISTAADLLRLTTLGDTLELGAGTLNAREFGVGDLGSIAEVGVDAGEDLAVRSGDAVHDDVTLMRFGAVAASTIKSMRAAS